MNVKYEQRDMHRKSRKSQKNSVNPDQDAAHVAHKTSNRRGFPKCKDVKRIPVGYIAFNSP